MHVAINAWFWDQPTTGSGQYTRRLVKGLTALETDLQITLVAPAPGEQEDGDERYARHPIACPRANLGKVWFEQVAFPRACRRLGADLAHVPYWAPPLRPSLPTVVTIHDLIPLLLDAYRGGLLVRLYTALVTRAARHAELVLTDSQASRRDILARLRLPEAHVRAIYLALEAGYDPTPTPQDADIRAKYDLPAQYVLYLGGFDVRKNLVTAIEAYGRAAPTIGERHPFVIAGRLPREDTAFTPHPRRLARERGVDRRCVHFPGFVAQGDEPALYRGATAFIFPSRYEGFGLPPLEAMACGTPVVGSDAASLPEVVGDGGMLFGPHDAEGMAQALIRLVRDAAFRADLSRRALRQASRFSWQHTARQTMAAYDDVAGPA